MTNKNDFKNKKNDGMKYNGNDKEDKNRPRVLIQCV